MADKASGSGRPWPRQPTLTIVRQPVAGRAAGATNSVAASSSGVSWVKFTLLDAKNHPIGRAAIVAALNGQAAWGFPNPAAGAGYRVLLEDTSGRATKQVSTTFTVTAPGPLPVPTPVHYTLDSTLLHLDSTQVLLSAA